MMKTVIPTTSTTTVTANTIHWTRVSGGPCPIAHLRLSSTIGRRSHTRNGCTR